MKKFLLHLLGFAILVYGIAAVVDGVITHQLRKLNSSPFANWNDLYKGDIRCDVLIMGSSRAYVQFNPRILDSCLQMNCYNLGSNGRPADAQILKYEVFRHEGNAKPKWIVYELYAGTLDTSNGYDRIQYVPYLRHPYLWRKTRKMEHFNWADGWIPCYRFLKYKEDIKAILKKESYYTRPENTLYKGFQDFDKKWDGSAYSALDSIEYQNNPRTLQQFEEFLEQCRKEQVRVVLVKAPYYAGATSKIKDREGMERLFNNIAERHRVPLLDYTYDPICNDTNCFYNATHLNRKGSTIFSEMLAHDLDSIMR